MDIRQQTIASFRTRFGSEPDFISRAPGRVNLLGEHVDYNDGFVLPAAINRDTVIAFRRSSKPSSTILALDLNEEISFDMLDISAKKDSQNLALPGWALYPAGVAWSLNAAGLETLPLEAVFASLVPRGAGLSSSASVELAFCVAWKELSGWSLSPLDMALICQRAENSYVGVNCGIMDQFASACGVKEHALCLDCRSLEWNTVNLPPDASIVIANTGVHRSLTTSAYNDRRRSCEEAVRLLKPVMPKIHSLRDVTPEEFNAHAGLLPAEVEKRARHIVDEIARTASAVQLLRSGDAAGFGDLMNQCHISLRDLYEVSCPELDTMVEIAQSLPGCFGARLTGAGFGGCTVNLVDQTAVDSFGTTLASAYERKTGLHPEIYVCHAADGASAEPI